MCLARRADCRSSRLLNLVLDTQCQMRHAACSGVRGVRHKSFEFPHVTPDTHRETLTILRGVLQNFLEVGQRFAISLSVLPDRHWRPSTSRHCPNTSRP